MVIDALALGVPVLASVKTPWSHLADAGCGATFDVTVIAFFERCLEWLARTDTGRHTCGTLGKSLVALRYTWMTVGRKLADAYEEI